MTGTVVFMLEERSSEAMLKSVVPRLRPDLNDVRYVVFEGRQDLEKRLVKRLSGWRSPDTSFVVVRDQDSADCVAVKRALVAKCSTSEHRCVIRIACHELESFYLGDLSAVSRAFDVPRLKRRQSESKYRDPDRLGNACEEFEKLTGALYQHIDGSRQIGAELALDGSNRSTSFNTLIAALHTL